jgi:type II secretory pathway pseudopilin PulG
MKASAWIRSEYRQRMQQGGFTYLGLMVIVLLMGVVLAAAAQVLHTSAKRDQELELLFVGNQFRLAIKAYYEHTPPMSRRYPAQLEDLLADPRFISTQRYLRKIYADPINGNTRWGLVRGASGEILGIHSLSEKEPIKKSNFDSADRSFENKKKYADWVFMYVPGQFPATAH